MMVLVGRGCIQEQQGGSIGSESVGRECRVQLSGEGRSDSDFASQALGLVLVTLSV